MLASQALKRVARAEALWREKERAPSEAVAQAQLRPVLEITKPSVTAIRARILG